MQLNSAKTKSLSFITMQSLLLAVFYFIAGQVSLYLSVSHALVTLVVFAAGGFALAAVILLGKRVCVGIFLGQLALALYNEWTLHSALGVSIINSLEAVMGAILFQRWTLQPAVEKLRDISGLWMLIFLVLQPLSASLGVLVLWLDGSIPTQQVSMSWFSWWFGNSLGQALITPLLLSFFATKIPITQKLHGVSWLILLIIPVGIISLLPISFSIITIVFTLAIPLLIFIAVKSSIAVVNLATVIFTVIVLLIAKYQLIQILFDGDIILLVDLNIHLLATILIGQFISALLTEYKQAHLAQEKTSEHLQKIADNFPGVIYQFRRNSDGSYCFPYASVGLQSIYHLSPEEVQDSAAKVFALLHPEDYDSIMDSIEKSAQHLTPWQCEYRVRFEDGTVRWLSAHSVPQREENGAILWHGFKKDITELKQKEIEYQTIIEASFSGFCCNDFSGRFVRVNSALCRMLGYSQQELLNMVMTDVEAAETPEKAAHIQAIMQAGHDTFESLYRCKDGSIIDVEINVLYVASLGQRFFVFINDITERKRVEATLKASEAFTVSILNSLTAHIAVLDDKGTIIMENRSWQQFAEQNGLPDYNLHNNYLRACQNALAEEGIADVLQGITSVLTGTQLNFHTEYPCHSPTEQRWFYMTVSPLHGAKRGVVISHENITERKLAEQKVQESEQRLNISQEYGGIGSWEADLINNRQIWSRTVHQLLGFPALSNPTWEDFLSIVHPDDRENVIAATQAHLNQGTKYDVEYRAILTDGKIHWMRSAGQAQFAADGTPVKFIGIVQDITERKQAEMGLRIAATVFEAQEGMLITDANNIILKVNHAFTDITGYSATETIGQTPRLLQSGRHDQAFYAELWKTINETGVWQGEIWDRRKNGECYPQWLTITAVKANNDNAVTHYVATLTDITERKATEEYINHLAFYDPLTQLPNRRLLQERLKHGIAINRRTGSRMAVLMIDLDKFKSVNDTLGHAAGDELLQQVAERIKDRLREVDMVARLGGDEFVIVIEDVSYDEAPAHIAKEIIDSLHQPFTLCQIHSVSIGASIGIAIHPQHGDNENELMDNADTALYRAKDQGRGCFAYFN